MKTQILYTSIEFDLSNGIEIVEFSQDNLPTLDEYITGVAPTSQMTVGDGTSDDSEAPKCTLATKVTKTTCPPGAVVPRQSNVV